MNFGTIISSVCNWLPFQINQETESNTTQTESSHNPIFEFSSDEQQANQPSFSFEFRTDDQQTNDPSFTLKLNMNNLQTNHSIASIKITDDDEETKHRAQYSFFQQINDYCMSQAALARAKSTTVYLKIIRATLLEANALCRYWFALHCIEDPTFKNNQNEWVSVFEKIETCIKKACIDIKELHDPIIGGCVVDTGIPVFLVKYVGLGDPIQIANNIKSKKSIDYLYQLLNVANKVQIENLNNMIVSKDRLYQLVLASGKKNNDLFKEYLTDEMQNFYVKKVFDIMEVTTRRET